VTIRWKVSNAESVMVQPFGTVDNAGEMTDTPTRPDVQSHRLEQGQDRAAEPGVFVSYRRPDVGATIPGG